MFSLLTRNIAFSAMAALLFTIAVVAQTPSYRQNINVTAACLAGGRPSTSTTPTGGSLGSAIIDGGRFSASSREFTKVAHACVIARRPSTIFI